MDRQFLMDVDSCQATFVKSHLSNDEWKQGIRVIVEAIGRHFFLEQIPPHDQTAFPSHQVSDNPVSSAQGRGPAVIIQIR